MKSKIIRFVKKVTRSIKRHSNDLLLLYLRRSATFRVSGSRRPGNCRWPPRSAFAPQPRWKTASSDLPWPYPCWSTSGLRCAAESLPGGRDGEDNSSSNNNSRCTFRNTSSNNLLSDRSPPPLQLSKPVPCRSEEKQPTCRAKPRRPKRCRRPPPRTIGSGSRAATRSPSRKDRPVTSSVLKSCPTCRRPTSSQTPTRKWPSETTREKLLKFHFRFGYLERGKNYSYLYASANQCTEHYRLSLLTDTIEVEERNSHF